MDHGGGDAEWVAVAARPRRRAARRAGTASGDAVANATARAAPAPQRRSTGGVPGAGGAVASAAAPPLATRQKKKWGAASAAVRPAGAVGAKAPASSARRSAAPVPPNRKGGGWPPLPKTAAVAIRLEEGASYAEALRKAQREIPLGEVGVTPAYVRRAADGGLLVAVGDPTGGAGADALAERLRAVLPGASVTRPRRMGEVRLVGIGEAASPEEVCSALAVAGGCGPGDVSLGPVRGGRWGAGAAWARLPLPAAAKVAREGRVVLGWAVARVELLAPRPLQCHRCWGFGHVRANCSGQTDRSGLCFRCGRTGHIARNCAEGAFCAVCREGGLPADHRMGGPACGAPRRRDGETRRRKRSARRRGRPPNVSGAQPVGVGGATSPPQPLRPGSRTGGA